jgi:hypothetical protein
MGDTNDAHVALPRRVRPNCRLDLPRGGEIRAPQHGIHTMLQIPGASVMGVEFTPAASSDGRSRRAFLHPDRTGSAVGDRHHRAPRPGRARSTARSCSTPSPTGSSDGRSMPRRPRRSSRTPSAWRSRTGGPRRVRSSIRTTAPSSPPGRSPAVPSNPAPCPRWAPVNASITPSSNRSGQECRVTRARKVMRSTRERKAWS